MTQETENMTQETENGVKWGYLWWPVYLAPLMCPTPLQPGVGHTPWEGEDKGEKPVSDTEGALLGWLSGQSALYLTSQDGCPWPAAAPLAHDSFEYLNQNLPPRIPKTGKHQNKSIYDCHLLLWLQSSSEFSFIDTTTFHSVFSLRVLCWQDPVGMDAAVLCLNMFSDRTSWTCSYFGRMWTEQTVFLPDELYYEHVCERHSLPV